MVGMVLELIEVDFFRLHVYLAGNKLDVPLCRQHSP